MTTHADIEYRGGQPAFIRLTGDVPAGERLRAAGVPVDDDRPGLVALTLDACTALRELLGPALTVGPPLGAWYRSTRVQWCGHANIGRSYAEAWRDRNPHYYEEMVAFLHRSVAAGRRPSGQAAVEWLRGLQTGDLIPAPEIGEVIGYKTDEYGDDVEVRATEEFSVTDDVATWLPRFMAEDGDADDRDLAARMLERCKFVFCVTCRGEEYTSGTRGTMMRDLRDQVARLTAENAMLRAAHVES